MEVTQLVSKDILRDAENPDQVINLAKNFYEELRQLAAGEPITFKGKLYGYTFIELREKSFWFHVYVTDGCFITLKHLSDLGHFDDEWTDLMFDPERYPADLKHHFCKLKDFGDQAAYEEIIK